MRLSHSFQPAGNAMMEPLPESLFAFLEQLSREGITGVEKYRKVRHYIQFKAREQHVPVCGTFELTPLCNLSCKMCYVHLNRNQMGSRDLLPAATWISLIDQAVDAGMMYATVTGGECLTYSGFKEVYLHLLSRGIEVEVLTNGILLTEEMVSFFDAHPPANVQVTVYGPDEDEYERITGARVFQKVMDNLKRLKAHNLPYSLAVTPNFYMTKGKELLQLVAGMDVPFQINSGLKIPREETGRQLWDASLDTYMELYREEQRLRKGEKLLTVQDEDLPDPGSADDSGNRKAPKGVRCAAGRSSFCLTWDGKMKPCNTFSGIEEDVMKTGFSDAWKKISGQVQEVMYPAECQTCPYEKVCAFCIVEHLEHGNPGHVNPDVCARTRRLVKEGFLRL